MKIGKGSWYRLCHLYLTSSTETNKRPSRQLTGVNFSNLRLQRFVLRSPWHLPVVVRVRLPPRHTLLSFWDASETAKGLLPSCLTCWLWSSWQVACQSSCAGTSHTLVCLCWQVASQVDSLNNKDSANLFYKCLDQRRN